MATASGPRAHRANVARQPNGIASRGSARPLTSTAAGIADCLIPKATPCRSSATWSAMKRLIAGCATAFAMPASARNTNSTASESARPAAASRQAEVAGSRRASPAARRCAPTAARPARRRTRRPGRTPSLPPPRRRAPRRGRRGSAGQGAHQEARQHGGRAGGDGEQRGTKECYASPTRLAITITPTMHSTAPRMSKTTPAFSIRVIGSNPRRVDDRVGASRPAA